MLNALAHTLLLDAPHLFLTKHIRTADARSREGVVQDVQIALCREERGTRLGGAGLVLHNYAAAHAAQCRAAVQRRVDPVVAMSCWSNASRGIVLGLDDVIEAEKEEREEQQQQDGEAADEEQTPLISDRECEACRLACDEELKEWAAQRGEAMKMSNSSCGAASAAAAAAATHAAGAKAAALAVAAAAAAAAENATEMSAPAPAPRSAAGQVVTTDRTAALASTVREHTPAAAEDAPSTLARFDALHFVKVEGEGRHDATGRKLPDAASTSFLGGRPGRHGRINRKCSHCGDLWHDRRTCIHLRADKAEKKLAAAAAAAVATPAGLLSAASAPDGPTPPLAAAAAARPKPRASFVPIKLNTITIPKLRLAPELPPVDKIIETDPAPLVAAAPTPQASANESDVDAMHAVGEEKEEVEKAAAAAVAVAADVNTVTSELTAGGTGIDPTEAVPPTAAHAAAQPASPSAELSEAECIRARNQVIMEMLRPSRRLIGAILAPPGSTVEDVPQVIPTATSSQASVRKRKPISARERFRTRAYVRLYRCRACNEHVCASMAQLETHTLTCAVLRESISTSWELHEMALANTSAENAEEEEGAQHDDDGHPSLLRSEPLGRLLPLMRVAREIVREENWAAAVAYWRATRRRIRRNDGTAPRITQLIAATAPSIVWANVEKVRRQSRGTIRMWPANVISVREKPSTTSRKLGIELTIRFFGHDDTAHRTGGMYHNVCPSSVTPFGMGYRRYNSPPLRSSRSAACTEEEELVQTTDERRRFKRALAQAQIMRSLLEQRTKNVHIHEAWKRDETEARLQNQAAARLLPRRAKKKRKKMTTSSVSSAAAAAAAAEGKAGSSREKQALAEEVARPRRKRRCKRARNVPRIKIGPLDAIAAAVDFSLSVEVPVISRAGSSLHPHLAAMEEEEDDDPDDFEELFSCVAFATRDELRAFEKSERAVQAHVSATAAAAAAAAAQTT